MGRWIYFALENNLQSGNIHFNQSTADIGKTICNIINKCAKAYIPRGWVKGYKFFWNKDLEAIRNKRIHLRNRAELSGATEDIQAWRQQAAVFRKNIIESKRKVFTDFISNVNYQNDSLKAYRYLAAIQNKKPVKIKEPIHNNRRIITCDKEIDNQFALTNSQNQKKGKYIRENSKIYKKEYKILKDEFKKMHPWAFLKHKSAT